MVNDLVADMLTRIRNAQINGHKSVKVLASSLVSDVLNVLKSEGFIEAFEACSCSEKPSAKLLDVTLKYYESGEPVIGIADRISKSGRRVYKGSDDLGKIRSGLGISILSTSQGVISDREARKRKIGGEVLAQIG